MKIHEKPIGDTAYGYTMETIAQADKLNPGTISGSAHLMGMRQGEPLIVMMDCLLQYALVYKVRFESNLADDYVLGPCWLEAAKGVRGLLNGDGVIAMQRGITTDSKDNGSVEAVFWASMNAAGFTEKDL